MMSSHIDHRSVRANGASFHVAVSGEGPPLLLLHGWPETWLTWDRLIERLSPHYTLYAPDLRGFGDSDKPDGPFASKDHAKDIEVLLDALDLDKVGVVGHDVGGAAMLPLGRTIPDRLSGMVIFDVFYPGVGSRVAQPDHLGEIWYQSLHLLDIAPKLVGASRESCKTYIGHFLKHWAHRKDAFDDILDRVVDAYMQPGNLEGGFAHYKGTHDERLKIMKDEAPPQPKITVPTRVLWPGDDPLYPPAWSDRMGETFADLELSIFAGVGHFPQREDVEGTAREIEAFFERLGWTRDLSRIKREVAGRR